MLLEYLQMGCFRNTYFICPHPLNHLNLFYCINLAFSGHRNTPK